MLTATILAIFYIPLFFVLVRRGARDGIAKLRGKPTGFQGHDGHGSDGDHNEPLGPPEPQGPHRPEPA
jgi:multidrug efflux pump